jgi:RNA polymerase sigma-70 factor, ECF subfamily
VTDTIYQKYTDEELMGKTAQGNEWAFETLVKRHEVRILNLIHRFIGDRHQAEDVAQEVFLRVWQAAQTYKPKAKFTTWIYRIAANLCLDNLKSAHHKQKFVHRDDEGKSPGEDSDHVFFSAGSPSPEDLLLAAEENRHIFAALRSLPDNQRMAVILCKFDGLTYEDVGKVLGCSISAVESLLVRAKKSLREILSAPSGFRHSQPFTSTPFPDPETSHMI